MYVWLVKSENYEVLVIFDQFKFAVFSYPCYLES